MKKNLSLVDLLIETEKEREIYFQNYLFYAKKIKKEVEKFLGKVEVLIFGSILKKREVARDIDILIITPKKVDWKTKRKVLKKIYKKIGLFHPFEFHFTTKDEFKNWYCYFIKKYKKV